MSGPFGVMGATFSAESFYEAVAPSLKGVLPDFVIVPCSLFVGYAVGITYAVATDTLINKRAGKWAVLVGTSTVAASGLLIHWVIGLPLGIAVGILFGAAVELKMMQEADARSYEPPRFTKADLAIAAPSMGPVSNAVGYLMDEKQTGIVDVKMNLPTLTNAMAPGLEQPQPVAIEGRYGDAYAQWQEENMQFYPERTEDFQLALAGDPYDDPNNLAVVEAHAQSTASWHSYGGGERSQQGASQDQLMLRSNSRSTRGTGGHHKSLKSPKKHSLGVMAKKHPGVDGARAS